MSCTSGAVDMMCFAHTTILRKNTPIIIVKWRLCLPKRRFFPKMMNRKSLICNMQTERLSQFLNVSKVAMTIIPMLSVAKAIRLELAGQAKVWFRKH